MAGKLRTSFIFNLINTVSSLLFPLITFPYASRVLFAEGIGQVNFFSSIITYISLFSSIGIPMYAVREIGRVRDDDRLRSVVAIEIIILHASLTLLGYAAVAIICVTVHKVQLDIPLFLLLSVNLIFAAIGCEWFYQGIEDFKYITIRGLIIKVISVVILFTLVKTRDDLMFYALCMITGTVGGNIFNFVRLRKYTNKTYLKIKELHPFRHLKPALHVFVLNLTVSIYVNLDTVMLGFISGNEATGLYVASTKITKMILGIVSSLGIVLLPRLSNLYANEKIDEFKRLANKSAHFIIALSLPLTIGLIIMAPTLIYLFAGPTYYPAIRTLRILSPIIIAIALSGLVGLQILYPQGKINKVIISTAIGAIVNFGLNMVLIPILAQDGAAIATLVAEITVTITMIIISSKYVPFLLISKKYLNYLMASLIMFCVLFLLNISPINLFLNMFLSPFIGMLTYSICLFMFRDSLFKIGRAHV